jgi:Zn-dependent oligopeptidase
MQHMCSTANYARLSGINVEWDYVELPSLTIENVIWQRDMLKKLSKHHAGGHSLPDNLIDDMIATRNLNIALRTLQQVFDSTMDFILHSLGEKSPAGYESSLIAHARNAIVRGEDGRIDVGQLYSWLKPALTLVEEIPSTNPAASWRNLIRGD